MRPDPRPHPDDLVDERYRIVERTTAPLRLVGDQRAVELLDIELQILVNKMKSDFI